MDFQKTQQGVYLYVIIGVLAAVIIAAGIYWFLKKEAPFLMVPDLTSEEEALNQDISDLEGLEEDKSLDNLEIDLTNILGEEVVVETASLENLPAELSSEIDSFSTDLKDLESLNNDTSLDALDEGLSGI